jgi:hypothetical protein
MKSINALIDSEKLPAGVFRPAVAEIEKPSCAFGDNLKQMVARSATASWWRVEIWVSNALSEDVPLLQNIDECRQQGKRDCSHWMLRSMIAVACTHLCRSQ